MKENTRTVSEVTVTVKATRVYDSESGSYGIFTFRQNSAGGIDTVIIDTNCTTSKDVVPLINTARGVELKRLAKARLDETAALKAELDALKTALLPLPTASPEVQDEQLPLPTATPEDQDEQLPPPSATKGSRRGK